MNEFCYTFIFLNIIRDKFLTAPHHSKSIWFLTCNDKAEVSLKLFATNSTLNSLVDVPFPTIVPAP